MSSLTQRVNDLQDRGFKLVDRAQLDSETTQPFGFPDVVMVADGTVAGADLDHGVAFLYRDDGRNDTVHFALPDNVSEMQLEQIGKAGAMMLETDSGAHSGYLFPHSPFNPNGMEGLKQALGSNGIDTAPIPMDPVAYGMFPYFNHPDRHPSSLSMDETIDILSHHLKGQVDAMDMSHEQRNRAFKITESEPQQSPQPSPGMSRGRP